MSQLSKKRIVIIILIWIFLLLLTAGITLYLHYASNKKEKNVAKSVATYNKLDYYSFYDENDLKITTEYTNSKEQKYSYIKINGLKNKKVENKINKELYDSVKNAENNKASSAYSRYYLNGFNILSVSINSYYNENLHPLDVYNYDLTTGEHIKFEDVFTNTANVLSIIYTGCYNKLSTDLSFSLLSLEREIEATKAYNEHGVGAQYYNNRTLEEIYKEKNAIEEKLSDIEALSTQYSKEVMNIQSKKFIITNYGIILYDKDNKEITLRARDNMEYYAFYEKYLKDKSIYEKDNIGKNNLFLSGNSNSYITYNRVEEVGDYALIDFEKWDIKANDNEISYLDELIKNYKNKFDKNKFTYLNVNSNYNNYSTNKIESLSSDIVICTMSKDYYNSVYKKKLFLTKENLMYFYNDYERDDKNINCNKDNIGVIYIGNDSYDKVEDIFKPDIDYKGYLIAKYYQMTGKYYNEGVMEQLKTKFAFGFTSYGAIYVDYLDNNKDTYGNIDASISIDIIPKEYLKIDIS